MTPVACDPLVLGWSGLEVAIVTCAVVIALLNLTIVVPRIWGGLRDWSAEAFDLEGDSAFVPPREDEVARRRRELDLAATMGEPRKLS